ncbi:polyphosphate kinase [Acidobacteria bacterium Mor1]|nr:polyphosphate kinase [Acidobacteria bacterium Mor1]
MSTIRENRSLNDPSLYVNRELGLVRFHRRVLSQAQDPDVPLLERLRFLSIFSSILDEFFEIRVGGLREQVALGFSSPGPDGLGAQEMLARVRDEVLELVEVQYRELNEVLLPSLAERGIHIYRRSEWTPEQARWIRRYFVEKVFPVLTPVGLDPAHPFPTILNKSLNFIVTMDGNDAFGRRSRGAVVQAPRVLPRLIPLPAEITGGDNGSVLLSSVIHAHVDDLFPGMRVSGCDQFRVTRNSDLFIDEEETENLLHALKGELPRRHFGRAVRLEVSDTADPATVDFLLEQFDLTADDLYRVNGPVNLHRLEALYHLADRPELKYAPFAPGVPRSLEPGQDLFAAMRDGDILLHHPFEGFSPVVELLRQAAADPDVLAIRQTVYRTGSDSPVARALFDAARNGKEVTAVIELRARFDEAANIDLATRLQEEGAKVVYGIVGFKAHAKMLMIVRREGETLRRYVHLGTGNYNPKTARAYTDFSLMTTDPQIGEDVHAIFQQLTGLGAVGELRKLVQTPFGLHDRLLKLIDEEARNAREGRPARIMAKMNSLIEPQIIRALYRASQDGVQIDLVVRGVCCLRPGVPGISENIRVVSVVGRFLEHSRTYHFHAGGEGVTLCSSADWMPRNLFRRVETAFPIEHPELRQRVIEEGLEAYVRDSCNAWVMQPDGDYMKVSSGDEKPFNAQRHLLESLAEPEDPRD